MTDIQLRPLEEHELPEFKQEMQRAFQYGYEKEYGPCEEVILPEKDIDESLKSDGAAACVGCIDGEMVGGAIVNINDETQHNHLDFLFVKVGSQSKGVGHAIWQALEAKYPATKVWKTCTPYFEKRNIHFYVNICGFHIVEFFNPRHKDPHQKEEVVGGMPDEAGSFFFEFEKQRNPKANLSTFAIPPLPPLIMEERKILARLHTLGIPELAQIQKLNELPGSFVNLECRFPNGTVGKIIDDSKTYLGTQVEKLASDRCYGVAADETQIAIFEYGCNGVDAELIAWIKL